MAVSRRLWVFGLAGLVGVSGVSWWLGARSQSPDQAAARASEPVASWITVGVEKRVLASTVVVRGDVVPEVSAVVGVPSSVEGSGVVTRVPPPVGGEVLEGLVVVEVSGRPVFVLEGEVPVYRSLQPGMSGADVAQLQAALVRLGFVPETDGVFGEATKQAVTGLYAQAGYVPVASPVTAADVLAAQSALRDAEAALVEAEAVLSRAQAGGAGADVVAAQAALNEALRGVDEAVAARADAVLVAQAGLTGAQNAYSEVLANPESTQADRDAAYQLLVQAQTGLAAAQRQGDAAMVAAQERVTVASAQLRDAKRANDVAASQAARDAALQSRDQAAITFVTVSAAAGPTVAQGEVVFVPRMPARVQAAVSVLGPVDAGGGEFGGGSSGLVTLAAGDLVVMSAVRAGDEGFVRVGMPVELLDETTGRVFAGRVESIAETAVLDVSGVMSRPAVIVADDELPGELAGANLRVTLTAAASEGEVLVVPLAAVSTSADGTTRVSVLDDGAENPVDVEVEVGISADGFVAVTPVNDGELTVADRVVVGR